MHEVLRFAVKTIDPECKAKVKLLGTSEETCERCDEDFFAFVHDRAEDAAVLLRQGHCHVSKSLGW